MKGRRGLLGGSAPPQAQAALTTKESAAAVRGKKSKGLLRSSSSSQRKPAALNLIRKIANTKNVFLKHARGGGNGRGTQQFSGALGKDAGGNGATGTIRPTVTFADEAREPDDDAREPDDGAGIEIRSDASVRATQQQLQEREGVVFTDGDVSGSAHGTGCGGQIPARLPQPLRMKGAVAAAEEEAAASPTSNVGVTSSPREVAGRQLPPIEETLSGVESVVATTFLDGLMCWNPCVAAAASAAAGASSTSQITAAVSSSCEENYRGSSATSSAIVPPSSLTIIMKDRAQVTPAAAAAVRPSLDDRLAVVAANATARRDGDSHAEEVDNDDETASRITGPVQQPKMERVISSSRKKDADSRRQDAASRTTGPKMDRVISSSRKKKGAQDGDDETKSTKNLIGKIEAVLSLHRSPGDGSGMNLEELTIFKKYDEDVLSVANTGVEGALKSLQRGPQDTRSFRELPQTPTTRTRSEESSSASTGVDQESANEKVLWKKQKGTPYACRSRDDLAGSAASRMDEDDSDHDRDDEANDRDGDYDGSGSKDNNSIVVDGGDLVFSYSNRKRRGGKRPAKVKIDPGKLIKLYKVLKKHAADDDSVMMDLSRVESLNSSDVESLVGFLGQGSFDSEILDDDDGDEDDDDYYYDDSTQEGDHTTATGPSIVSRGSYEDGDDSSSTYSLWTGCSSSSVSTTAMLYTNCR